MRRGTRSSVDALAEDHLHKLDSTNRQQELHLHRSNFDGMPRRKWRTAAAHREQWRSWISTRRICPHLRPEHNQTGLQWGHQR